MNNYSAEFISMWCVLGGCVALLLACVVERFRARRAAREAAKRDRLYAISKMGFRSAFMRGLVDEQGNVISRVGYPPDDAQ